MKYFVAQLIDPKNLPQPGKNSFDKGPGSTELATIFGIVFTIAGAIALLMVVIAGFRYIRAGSNDTIISEAKRQMAHALVGLIVVASAAIIVNFVLGRAG